MIGLGLQDALRHAVPSWRRHDYPEMVERYRHHFLATDHELTLFEGAVELIASLHAAGYLLAVATTQSRQALTGRWGIPGWGVFPCHPLYRRASRSPTRRCSTS